MTTSSKPAGFPEIRSQNNFKLTIDVIKSDLLSRDYTSVKLYLHYIYSK